MLRCLLLTAVAFAQQTITGTSMTLAEDHSSKGLLIETQSNEFRHILRGSIEKRRVFYNKGASIFMKKSLDKIEADELKKVKGSEKYEQIKAHFDDLKGDTMRDFNKEMRQANAVLARAIESRFIKFVNERAGDEFDRKFLPGYVRGS